MHFFRNDNSMKRENSIEITDLMENAVREINDIEQVASELLAAATKYHLEGLIVDCTPKHIAKILGGNLYTCSRIPFPRKGLFILCSNIKYGIISCQF